MHTGAHTSDIPHDHRETLCNEKIASSAVSGVPLRLLSAPLLCCASCSDDYFCAESSSIPWNENRWKRVHERCNSAQLTPCFCVHTQTLHPSRSPLLFPLTMRRITLVALAVVAILAVTSGIYAEVDRSSPAASSSVLSKPVLRVGVIGSGITGASTAYFLHSLLHDLFDLRFTVWERDHRVGGRITDVHLGGFRMEGGGSILHESNRYMRHFATKLNLSLHEPPPKIDSTVGVWNGGEFLLRLGGSSGWLGQLWDGLTIVWRYGLDFLRLEQIVRGVAESFASIYAIQDRRESFDSPRAMLRAMGLWEHTQIGFHEWLHQQRTWVTGCDRHAEQPHSASSGRHHHHPEAILHELAVAATRINYNQDLDLNAMAGSVGLIPLTNPKIWSVQGGNTQVPKGLLQMVDAEVKLGHTVRTVSRSNPDGEITVSGVRLSRRDQQQPQHAQPTSDSTFSDQVDLLIVATPLELAHGLEFKIAASKRTDIASETGSASPVPAAEELLPAPDAGVAYPRSFVSTHATFLSARLRPEPFGLSSSTDLPSTILTTEANADLVPFTSIAAYAYANPEEAGAQGRRFYKVFSRSALDSTWIDEWFEDVDPSRPVHRLHWKAYPRFAPPERFRPSFELYPDIWDPTALEPAASAMEVCAIAARNVALAIARRARDKIKRERIIMDEEHDEL